MDSIFNENIRKRRNLLLYHAKIIAIEGIDGSGKTTLAESCVKKLSDMGYKVSQFHTSSNFNCFWNVVNEGLKNGYIDRDINQLFHNVAFLTYLNTLFIDELNNNDFVIGDWYIYGKMLLSELYTKNQNCISKKILIKELKDGNVILPDYSFFLDTMPEIAFQRIKKRQYITETKESLEMLKYAYNLWEEYLCLYNIQKLDGNATIKELTESVISKVFQKK